MDTFNWKPDKGVENEVDQLLREVQFGDGVTQVQQRFLAGPKQKFSLTFTRPTAEIRVIFDFLMRQRGKRFRWSLEQGTQHIVRCTTFKRSYTGIVDTLTCEFVEEPI